MKPRKPSDTPAPALDRRSFLKLGGICATLPVVAGTEFAASPGAPLPQTKHGSITDGELLPAIPRPADLASDRLVHHFQDLFNPPAAQNEWGYLQATKSVSGITAISFPPFICCGTPAVPFSPGDLQTCELYLNGRILASYPHPAATVAFTWYPHRILRETLVEGMRFTTETFLPAGKRACAERIEVRNQGREQRKFSLGFDLRAGISKKNPWHAGYAAELDNRLTASESHGCVIFEARHSQAVSVQGVSPRPTRIEQQRMLICETTLEAGETRVLQYLNVIGDDADAAVAAYDQQQAAFDDLLKENEERFTAIMRSAFTPGNSQFSGHLPQLSTRSRELWKLYYMGFASLLISRRASPDALINPAYVTIPRICPTYTYIWDAMLASLSLALLDPAAFQKQIEDWLNQNMHAHLATDYLSGKGVGAWYGVNDLGMLRCVDTYLRASGDYKWLDKPIAGKPVLEHLVDSALFWKTLDKQGHGLADYGNMDNLLEVVSTWTHEVPAINAGNVYGMRFVASLLAERGDGRAARLRSEASELAARINRLLYVDGKGWWRCGQPDGTFNEVRHCVDFLTVLDTMFEDLSPKQKAEMRHFFWSELHTPVWMRALSPADADATWGMRADHSWLGAYTAWPSMSAKGLYKIDDPARVADWVKGVSKSANQGPFGQAHMAAGPFPLENGGALKCPFDQPYWNDWCEVAGGSYIDLIVDSIFGVTLTMHDGIQVHSRVHDFDPAAELINLDYQGRRFAVSSAGARQIA